MNNILRYVLSFIIGLIGGSTFIYIGVGTSLMIPLIICLGVIENFQKVIGTITIPVISPVTIFPLYEFYKRDLLDIKVGLFLAVGYFIGSYVTSKYFLNVFHKDTLCFLYGLFSIVIGFVFIRKSKILKKFYLL
jgi:uncharacterized membrane protein YfcA